MSQHTVVVGGSSGIGFATAEHLLSLGGRVTIGGRDERRLAQAARRLGQHVQTIMIDATINEVLPGVFERIGSFDHLVLALGSGAGVGPLASVDLEDVKRGFQEKVYAHFGVAEAALPFVNPTGSLTFISAVSAHAAMPGTAGIGAANAAIEAIVPVLAAELKPLRVNGVSPGVIDTPWWDGYSEEDKRAAFADFSSKTPVGRVGKPEDVAEAIAFLINNTFVNGHILICDGGLRLTI